LQFFSCVYPHPCCFMILTFCSSLCLLVQSHVCWQTYTLVIKPGNGQLPVVAIYGWFPVIFEHNRALPLPCLIPG
jgi:energy-coupling factor transporter transmembrane protein EcfT